MAVTLNGVTVEFEVLENELNGVSVEFEVLENEFNGVTVEFEETGGYAQIIRKN